MSISFNSNFDKFEKELERKAQAVSGNVTFNELFIAEFMIKYTSFETLDSLVNAYDSDITNETFQESLTPEFDHFIAENSQFSSWQVMLNKASEEYVVKNLKF